jgi:hypothetical protein
LRLATVHVSGNPPEWAEADIAIFRLSRKFGFDDGSDGLVVAVDVETRYQGSVRPPTRKIFAELVLDVFLCFAPYKMGFESWMVHLVAF